jgi:hypothetical protein
VVAYSPVLVILVVLGDQGSFLAAQTDRVMAVAHLDIQAMGVLDLAIRHLLIVVVVAVLEF